MDGYLSMQQPALEQERQRLANEMDRYKAMQLKLDMSRGKPAPEQLDLSLDLLDIKDYADDTGVDARNYGNLEGLPEARRFFASLLGLPVEQTIVGPNASLQLMYGVIDNGWRFGFSGEKPWQQQPPIKFICPVPGYDRHFRITESFGIEMVTVPMTPDGPDMDAVERLAADKTVKGIWCIPIYSNPDGYTYSDETVRRLAAMKTAPDFRIMWDNAYGFHHLTSVKESCPNIVVECEKAGCPDRAVTVISTSKITFAGAGVSALGASTGNVKALLSYLFPITIGFDKMNQLRHVRYLKDMAGLDAHMQKQAALIAPKFDRVVSLLHERLGGRDVARWTEPKGGYFISLYVMDGCAKRVVQLCKEAGVVLTGAGAAFPYGDDPKDCHIRIAPTYPPLSELETAAELLCVATRLASVEKLLAAI